MTILTNKLNLIAYVINKPITIPAGSSLEVLEKSSGYHAYYEMHTYKFICKFENNIVSLSFSKDKYGKQPKVDCVEGNMFSNKKHWWPDVFDEEFPV